MKSRLVVVGLSALLVASLAGAAWARNPHCAGGIQYVVQGLRDKEKGNAEDYLREMNKAVDQLSLGATEDPADYEAQGYLGWAYAELDSAGPAGVAFTSAMAGAQAKGDKKKIDAIQANRDHYWSIAFNDGIKNIQDAQQFLDAGAKDDAAKTFAVAITKLTRASQLRSGHPQTIRNLATAYALAGDNNGAETTLRAGIVSAAADTSSHILAEALRTVRANKALALVDAKKYDEAITYYLELTKEDAGNHDLWMGLGNSYYSRAGTRADAAKKADYKSAADAYSKAYQLKTSDMNVAFNAALSYQNAGEVGMAEAQWRTVLKVTPNDPDALSGLGAVLADEKKYDEAVELLHRAVLINPKEKIFHRQLGAVYSKAGNNEKSTQELLCYLALQRGIPVSDAETYLTFVHTGTPQGNTMQSLGKPDAIYQWAENDAQVSTFKIQTVDQTVGGKTIKVTQLPPANVVESWFYWSKNLAFHFKGAAVFGKSDWNAKK